MTKVLDCAKVDPASGCPLVARGETVDELLRKAGEHTKEHGSREGAPEMMEQIRANIHEG
jgi:predicted small metal-binding protein